MKNADGSGLMADGFWTQARIAQLKRLWSAGKSAATIGFELGGISRAAVLGKIFRLRLGPDHRTPARDGKARKVKHRTKRKHGALGDIGRNAEAAAHVDAPARRRAGKPKPASNAPAARPRRKTLFELTNECCRWPYGELGSRRFLFCGAVGADISRGIPYCPRHMKQGYLIPPTLVGPLPKIAARAAAKISRNDSSPSRRLSPQRDGKLTALPLTTAALDGAYGRRRKFG
jgi:GcrA cell cycle regulator